MDGGGQAALKKANETSVGLFKQIGKGGAQPYLKATEVSTAGIGDKVKGIVWYSMP